MARMIFVMEQSPEAGSECPMLDLTEPISRGVLRSLQNILSKALISSGSPTFVAVPWASR